MRAIAEEHLSELHHLEQADTHDGCFRIVAPAEAGDEAGGEGDDVFEGTGEGDAGDVGDDGNVEVGAVEEGFDGGVVEGGEVGGLGGEADFGGLAFGVFVFGDLGEVELGGSWRGAFGRGGAGVHGWRVVGDGGFGEFFLGDFIGDVGSGEGAAVDAKFLANGLGEEGDVFAGDVDAFDAGDAAGVGEDVAFHLVAEAADELMRQVEDQDAGPFDGLLEGGRGDEV